MPFKIFPSPLIVLKFEQDLPLTLLLLYAPGPGCPGKALREKRTHTNKRKWPSHFVSSFSWFAFLPTIYLLLFIFRSPEIIAFLLFMQFLVLSVGKMVPSGCKVFCWKQKTPVYRDFNFWWFRWFWMFYLFHWRCFYKIKSVTLYGKWLKD